MALASFQADQPGAQHRLGRRDRRHRRFPGRAAAINGHTTRRLPDILLGLVVPVAITLYMLKFSRSYPDRVTHHEPAQAPATL